MKWKILIAVLLVNSLTASERQYVRCDLQQLPSFKSNLLRFRTEILNNTSEHLTLGLLSASSNVYLLFYDEEGVSIFPKGSDGIEINTNHNNPLREIKLRPQEGIVEYRQIDLCRYQSPETFSGYIYVEAIFGNSLLRKNQKTVDLFRSKRLKIAAETGSESRSD